MTEVKKISSCIPKFDFFENLTAEEFKQKEKQIQEYEKAIRQRERNAAFRGCGIGEEYWDYNFENFKADKDIQKKMISKARDFFKKVITGEKSNLICVGGPGTGKTFLMLALAYEFLDKVKSTRFELKEYFTVQYITSRNLVDRMKKAESFNPAETRSKILKDLLFADILIIDEVGKGDPKIESDSLFAVLDIRYQHGKWNMLGSNNSYSNLTKFLGDPTMSRLNASNGLLVVDTTGLNDMRQEAHNIK